MEEFTFSPFSIDYPALTDSVGPRPIAWVSTLNENGSTNLAPFSFYTVASGNPPVLIICPLASKDVTRPLKDTPMNIRRTGECTIGVVTTENMVLVNETSVDAPYGVSEAELVNGIYLLPSTIVQAKRIGNSPIQFECKLAKPEDGQAITVISSNPLGGIVILLEIVHTFVAEEVLTNGKIDRNKLNLVSRMGGKWWRTSKGDTEMPNKREYIPKN